MNLHLSLYIYVYTYSAKTRARTGARTHACTHLFVDDSVDRNLFCNNTLTTGMVTRSLLLCDPTCDMLIFVTRLIHVCTKNSMIFGTSLIRMRDVTLPLWSILIRDTTSDMTRRVTWHIHICDMPHSYVRRDSFMYVPRLICMCDVKSSELFVTWLNHACNSFTRAIYSFVWLTHTHDSFIRVTHAHVWDDSFLRETWVIHGDAIAPPAWHDAVLMKHCNTLQYAATHCNTTHSHVQQDRFKCARSHVHTWVTQVIHMCDLTDACVRTSW